MPPVLRKSKSPWVFQVRVRFWDHQGHTQGQVQCISEQHNAIHSISWYVLSVLKSYAINHLSSFLPFASHLPHKPPCLFTHPLTLCLFPMGCLLSGDSRLLTPSISDSSTHALPHYTAQTSTRKQIYLCRTTTNVAFMAIENNKSPSSSRPQKGLLQPSCDRSTLTAPRLLRLTASLFIGYR